jgi:hypothetical protein
VLCFVKSLPWLFNRNLLTDIKISFYCNTAILCAEMSRVNWDLKRFFVITIDRYRKIQVLGIVQ